MNEEYLVCLHFFQENKAPSIELRAIITALIYVHSNECIIMNDLREGSRLGAVSVIGLDRPGSYCE